MLNVYDEVAALSEDLIMLSSVDLRQCYYSLRLSEETVDSGVANILSPWGAYQCLSALTGCSSVPSFLCTYLREEMDKNGSGEYSPLTP